MNNKNIILSVVGPDKPGIVADISKIIKNHSGNIDKSRMIRLGDLFTIMVSIRINKQSLANLNKELMNYSNYQISIHELGKDSINNNNDEKIQTLYLNGIDNEGLVYKITNELAKLDINIEELETDIINAPMSGLTLFSLTAKVTHPKLDHNVLKEKMNILAAELNVTITLGD